MVERPHKGPLPRAHAVPYGSPPLTDGSPDYPHRLTPRARRWGQLAWWLGHLAALAVLVFGRQR